MQHEFKFDIAEDGYKALSGRVRTLITRKKEIEAELDPLKEDLLHRSGGERMEHGLKISERERKGSVDIKRMIEDGVIDEYIAEKYTRPSTKYWEVRTY